MPERLSISEAPKATLGAPGVEQNIPMAERATDGEVTAKRTTIADMANFFGGGGGGIQPEIIQFGISEALTGDLSIPRGLLAGAMTQPFRLRFDTESVAIIAGSEDFYALGPNELIFSEAGVYRFTISPTALYTPSANTGAYRYTARLITALNNVDETMNGDYIRPYGIGGQRQFLLGQGITVRQVLGRAVPFTAFIQIVNSGNGAGPTTQDTFRPQGEAASFRPAFTAEYLGPLPAEAQNRI